MRKLLLSLLFICGWMQVVQSQNITSSKSEKDMGTLSPSPLQKQIINRGYGMFIHFGVNTFNQVEWSDGNLPASTYNPTDLDPDQWVATAKEAGFRHIVLVTKHHDGFCLWDSKYTDYDVAASPVKTDVIKAVATACKKYGVKLGLYYSLWDRHESSYKDKDPQKYISFMKGQLTELLSNNGPICEIWFDGAWDRKAEDWDILGVYSLIKKLQPDCAVTVNHTIGVGKENANGIGQPRNFQQGDIIRFWPVDFRTKDPNLARYDDPKLYNYGGQLRYLPFEHTLCISDRWNWFQKKDILPARPLDELEQLFYWCTANDNVMLLNVPPDQTGRLRENEQQRLFELADRLGIRKGKKPLPAGPKNSALKRPVVANNTAKDSDANNAVDYDMESYWLAKDAISAIEISLDKNKLFNCISLFEYAEMKDLGDGFSSIRNFGVSQFSIEVFDGKSWKEIYKGKEIGACLTIKLNKKYQAEKLRITILDASRPAGFYHIIVADGKKNVLR
ncbi:alpha-L-fucosidase [Flavobacterium sp. ZB4P13]|uniref:alpha-L-fucosidase n=1 Tax=Flavobacterium sp. ZB4P13 TaxID=3401728 RepID=UPI003AAF9EBB